MSWEDYSKGQAVRFRALGGWIKGHIGEVYDNSVSVVFSLGSEVATTRVYDTRSIKPWTAKPPKKDKSTSNDQPLFD